MKPGKPVLQSVRLLDQLRERIRSMHYSLSTKKAAVHGVRFFIRWQGRGGVMRHNTLSAAQIVLSWTWAYAMSLRQIETSHACGFVDDALRAPGCSVATLPRPWTTPVDGLRRPQGCPPHQPFAHKLHRLQPPI